MQTMPYAPDNEYPDLAAEVFTLLSDATRVRIILALDSGESSVNELAEMIGKSPTVTSQHLAKLRMGRIVQSRHEGTRCVYSLIDEHARRLVNHAVFQAEHIVDIFPQHHSLDIKAAQGDTLPVQKAANK